VEPASSAFEAQSNEIRELQQQMASLGIATLSQQKFVAESADARRLDKVDTNSMLAAVSLDLEQTLQRCFDISAEYLGLEPPSVHIDRDFDINRLIGQDIAALTVLFEKGVITREEYRLMLAQGEVMPSMQIGSLPTEEAGTESEGEMTEEPIDQEEMPQVDTLEE